jgi:large subunit ribosomal protein L17
MRHKKKGNHLGRTSSHKKALMRNMAAQLFEHKEIKTTDAKAKELRGYAERLITYGKKGSVHHRRLAFKFLQNKEIVTSLFDEIAPAYESREGGYTRIIKLGKRKGDGASVSIIQLVDFEQAEQKPKAAKPAKKEKEAKEVKEKANKEVEKAAEPEVTDEESKAEPEVKEDKE